MVEKETVKSRAINLNFFYGQTRILKNINLDIYEKKVTAIIGPSGCGKTTFLRCFNRLHDLYPNNRYEGKIILYPDNINILDSNINVTEIRMRIGMVFQKPNPFPKSIFENVAFGLRIRGINKKSKLKEIVEESLMRAWLFDEVKDKLKKSALELSGGQQQRLCIARALAVNPEILLFDEPTSALDPISASKIEELIVDLKKYTTIIIVTHNLQQAARISDYTAYMYLGEIIEFGKTEKIFTSPQDKRTENYITGRLG